MLERLYERLDRYPEQQEFTPLKDNTVRSALRYRTGLDSCPEVFVKRYKCRGWYDICKHLVYRSKALAEWQALCALEARGLPGPRPLAFSEKRRLLILRDSCLVMEALPDTRPLHEFIEQARPGFSRRTMLAVELGGLVRRLHRHGVYYRDLHAGNILIRPRDGGHDLWCIDLHRAVFTPRMLTWMRVNDLARLCNSLPATVTDGLRFLKEYCRGSDENEKTFGHLRRTILSRQRRLRSRRILSRSKRCIKNSTAFAKQSTWAETCFVRRDFGREMTERAIALHRDAVGREHPAPDPSSKSLLTVHRPDDGMPYALCVKRYRYMGPVYALKNLFRKSRAHKSWLAANGLIVRSIQTPEPLAMLERTCGPLTVESIIITRWLEHARELHAYVDRQVAGMPEDARAGFIKGLARALRQLHDSGVYHADLKANNILVQEQAGGGQCFYFIDLDRVLFRAGLSFKQRANNLAQINASVSRLMGVKDRLKFFRFYAKGTAVYRERKRYYRKILAISRTKITAPYNIDFNDVTSLK